MCGASRSVLKKRDQWSQQVPREWSSFRMLAKGHPKQGKMRSERKTSGKQESTRSKKSDKSTQEVTDEEEDASFVADMTQSDMQQISNVQSLLDAWVEQTVQKGVVGLRREFERVRQLSIPSAKDCRQHVMNIKSGRNRYPKVFCLDRTRVRLSNRLHGTDYIHANYIDTPSRNRRFILTQGPTNVTAQDLWHMVMQERSEYIVMLTGFEEKGVVKCAHYIPEVAGTSKTFGSTTICCIECETIDDFDCVMIRRKVSITEGDSKPLVVRHYHWTDWPDHGVPKSDTSALQLLDIVRTSEKPIIVHCSAGIGRSGVVLVTEYVLEALTCNEDCSDMGRILVELRKQRAGLVQTVQQYLFIHRMLLLFFIATERINPNEATDGFIRDYEAFVHSKKNA